MLVTLNPIFAFSETISDDAVVVGSGAVDGPGVLTDNERAYIRALIAERDKPHTTTRPLHVLKTHRTPIIPLGYFRIPMSYGHLDYHTTMKIGLIE